jgi:SAM-dependent methyltransferase
MEPTEENRRAWNELQRRRVAAVAAAPGPNPEVLALVPDPAGRRVLLVSCGSGETAAKLVERGALVTGIDRDEDALALARERAPGALFLVAELDQLPAHLRRRRFDVVYACPGALSHGSAGGFVAAAASALQARGTLVLHERHPVADCIDPATLRWRADYFDLERSPGQLVDAAVAAGLVVRRLAELRAPATPRRGDPRIPAELVLVAGKP